MQREAVYGGVYHLKTLPADELSAGAIPWSPLPDSPGVGRGLAHWDTLVWSLSVLQDMPVFQEESMWGAPQVTALSCLR